MRTSGTAENCSEPMRFIYHSPSGKGKPQKSNSYTSQLGLLLCCVSSQPPFRQMERPAPTAAPFRVQKGWDKAQALDLNRENHRGFWGVQSQS